MKRQIMGRDVVVAITDGRLDFGTWERILRCCAARPLHAEHSPRLVGAKQRSRSSGPRGGFNA